MYDAVSPETNAKTLWSYTLRLLYECKHAQLSCVIGVAYLFIGLQPVMSSNFDISILTYPIMTILTIWFSLSQPYYETDNWGTNNS